MTLSKKQKERFDECKAAVVVARQIFAANEVSAEMIFGQEAPGGLRERIFDQEDPETCEAQLKESVKLAQELFGTPAPTPSMVFGVFDIVFVEYEETN